jgi:chromosome segregation ATPase
MYLTGAPNTASSALVAQISPRRTQIHGMQLEIDSLQQVLDSLREQLRSSEDREAILEADRQRQMTELQSQWANEKSSWESERTLLATQNAASERSRIQAEQDREFIREQYANASAYVTTVREENSELEQRVKIAEEQSKKGVELIKSTFELQVAKLQDEAKAWRRMAEFMIQKDIKTNDVIRRRAAEEPELRVLCVRQKKALREAGAKIDGLQVDLQEKSRLCDASTEELEHCKKENARLHSDLNEALIKLDRIGRSGDESTQGNGHEFVYRCMWRVETDNSQSECPDVFSTMRVRRFLCFLFR